MFVLWFSSEINQFWVNFRKKILKIFAKFSMFQKIFHLEEWKFLKIFSKFFKNFYMVICFIENGTTFEKIFFQNFWKFSFWAKFRPKMKIFLRFLILMNILNNLAPKPAPKNVAKPRYDFLYPGICKKWAWPDFGGLPWVKNGQTFFGVSGAQLGCY